MTTRILFVCMGNICRSPTAEGVMRHLVTAAGCTEEFEIDSAGTGNWHAGQSPDRRARQAAAARGITVDGHAREIQTRDFDDFDLVVAMDRENLRELRRRAPRGTEHKLRMLADVEVPDPYYGDAAAFDEVLDIVQAGCSRLLDELRQA
ncbi:MAG TPA: low molecular weight protein-tyrosine-phosphatase [Jatrophihabitantaceae bacterium]|nr:low molecular weight protein-tyrosine-phosphatase [Jatrophihabitantaceae bacterium]